MSNKKFLKSLFSRKSHRVHPCLVTVKPADQAKTVEYSCRTVLTDNPVHRNNSMRPKTARPLSSHKTLPSITASKPQRLYMYKKTLPENETSTSQITPEHSTVPIEEKKNEKPGDEATVPTLYSYSKLQELFSSLDVLLSQVQLCEGYYMDVRPKTSGGYAYDLIFDPARRQHPKLRIGNRGSQKDSVSISLRSLKLDIADDNQSVSSESDDEIWSSDGEDSSDDNEESEMEPVPIGPKLQLGTPHQVSMPFNRRGDQVTSQPLENDLESVKVEKPNFFTAAKPPMHPSAWKRIEELKNTKSSKKVAVRRYRWINRT